MATKEKSKEVGEVKLLDLGQLIIGALKPAEKVMPIDGFGDVLIRGVSQKRNEDLIKKAKEKKTDHFKYLLVESIWLADGSKRVFSEADIPALGDCGAGALDKLMREILILNGWMKDDSEKNSQATQ